MKKECDFIVKKEYEVPDVEVVLVDTKESVLQTGGSLDDPIEDDD